MKAFWSDPALRRRISPLRIVQNPDVDFFFRIFGIAVEKRTDEHFIVPAKSGVLKRRRSACFLPFDPDASATPKKPDPLWIEKKSGRPERPVRRSPVPLKAE